MSTSKNSLTDYLFVYNGHEFIAEADVNKDLRTNGSKDMKIIADVSSFQNGRVIDTAKDNGMVKFSDGHVTRTVTWKKQAALKLRELLDLI